MKQGSEDNKALENAVSRGTVLPRHLKCAEPIVMALIALPDTMPVRTEYFIGVDNKGKACTWDAKDVLFRTKMDVAAWSPAGGWIIDWKTGRTWEDPFELQLQGLLCALHHPDVPSWMGQYYWFQDRRLGEKHDLSPNYAARDLFKIYGEMLECERVSNWSKKKNKLCKWCDVANCEHYEGPKS